MFKIVGAVLGFFLYRFFGAVVGFILGSFIDRTLAYGVGGVNPLSRAHRQSVFLDTVFLLMGKISKADGRVSEEEIAHVEMTFQKVGMSTEHRQKAIEQFKLGSAADFDIRPTLNEFMAVCGHTNNLKQMLLVYLIVMAFADAPAAPSFAVPRIFVKSAARVREFESGADSILEAKKVRDGLLVQLGSVHTRFT